MAKFYGNVGFAEQQVETDPGVYEEVVKPKPYKGDLLENNRRLQASNELNDNITISNKISIVADPFANNHIYSMRYVEFQGAKWKISNVDVQRPRLILTIGGLYNEQ